MRIANIPYNSDRFTYNTSDKTFTIDSSDMSGNHFQQLWNDACDEGFAMISNITGNTVTFYLSDIIYNGFGDDTELTHWIYKPIDTDVRKYPQLAGVKVIIFND